MEITTLGTSHGDHTYCRFNSSTLFDIGGHLYLVDAGAPVNALLIRAGVDMRKIKAVFITHMHDDHVGGLPGLIKSLIKYPDSEQHTHIYLPEPKAIPALLGWLDAQHLTPSETMISLHAGEAEESVFYDDGILKVSRKGTRHLTSFGIPVSFSYVLQAEGKKVLCTGDLSADFSDFPLTPFTEDADLCFCEATHYAPQDALPMLAKGKFKRLVFNHVHNPWHGDGEEKLLNIYKSLSYPVAVAHDGDRFTL